jgi:SPP1 family predicted phage head-tail adaptor
LKIGDLKKRITLQYQTKVPDGMGGFTTGWVDVASVFAAIWPISASEQVANMQVSMTITHRIRIRYRADIKASWKIKYGTKYFNIVGIINPNTENEMLDLMVKEVA